MITSFDDIPSIDFSQMKNPAEQLFKIKAENIRLHAEAALLRSHIEVLNKVIKSLSKASNESSQ